MRSLALAVFAVLLVGLAACQDKESAGPPASPTSAAPATSPASISPSHKPVSPATRPASAVPRVSPSPKLVGPRTVCGEVQAANGDLLAAAVQSGRTTCATVLRVLRAYYRPSTPKQGTAGVATVDGWRCVTNTAAESSTTGRASSCRNGSTTIVADIIP